MKYQLNLTLPSGDVVGSSFNKWEDFAVAVENLEEYACRKMGILSPVEKRIKQLEELLKVYDAYKF